MVLVHYRAILGTRFCNRMNRLSINSGTRISYNCIQAPHILLANIIPTSYYFKTKYNYRICLNQNRITRTSPYKNNILMMINNSYNLISKNNFKFYMIVAKSPKLNKSSTNLFRCPGHSRFKSEFSIVRITKQLSIFMAYLDLMIKQEYKNQKYI